MRERLERTPEEIEVYKELHRRTFRLRIHLHWSRKSDRDPRVLNPALRAWLDDLDAQCYITLGKRRKSKIVFEHADHAMLFKLTWL